MSRGESLYVGLVLACLGAAGCAKRSHELPDRDDIYYGDAEPEVLCAASIDDEYHITDDAIEQAMDRAHQTHETLHLYTHDPGHSVALATIETTLALASDRNMNMVTYAALGAGGSNGSLALSFDDDSVADWTAIRPLLQQYHAHVTFFVTHYLTMTDDEHQQLHDLAADGHAIEYHSVAHEDAVKYVTAHGLEAYLADDITPGIEAMEADGFPLVAFAYPHGSRNAAIDTALTPYFQHLRAIASTCPR